MKFSEIPSNPYKSHPERHTTSRLRCGVFGGTLACVALSTYETIKLGLGNPEAGGYQYAVIASAIIASMPVISEVQERVRSRGEGGRGWVVPDFPDAPPPHGGGGQQGPDDAVVQQILHKESVSV